MAWPRDSPETPRPARQETTRPETYGLLGWTDHAGFSLSVSRDLEFHLPDRDVRNNRGAWQHRRAACARGQPAFPGSGVVFHASHG